MVLMKEPSYPLKRRLGWGWVSPKASPDVTENKKSLAPTGIWTLHGPLYSPVSVPTMLSQPQNGLVCKKCVQLYKWYSYSMVYIHLQVCWTEMLTDNCIILWPDQTHLCTLQNVTVLLGKRCKHLINLLSSFRQTFNLVPEIHNVLLMWQSIMKQSSVALKFWSLFIKCGSQLQFLWQLSFSFFEPTTQVLTAFFKASPSEISVLRWIRRNVSSQLTKKKAKITIQIISLIS